MSMKWHDATVAGTPEVSTVVQAGDNRPVTSSAVKSAITKVENDIAIRVVGNKTTYASGAAIGQYVIVSGSTITGITDGMYKAAKAIPYNTVIDSTYLTAVSGGAANDLRSAIESFLSPLGLYRNVITLNNGIKSTYTFQLDTPFLLVIASYSANNASRSGIYYGVAYGDAYSAVFITPIVPSNAVAVTISGRTLSITPSESYLWAYVVPLNSLALAST